MIYFKTTASVEYSCCIEDKEQEQEIMNKAIEFKNADRKECISNFDSYYISKAIRYLYYEDIKSNIDLYKNSTEIDFSTEEIEFDEFGQKSAEELFDEYMN